LISRKLTAVAALFVSLFFVTSATADPRPEWTNPFPAFRIAGDAPGSPRTGPGSRVGLYYVGSEDLASFLVVTPAGDILINSNLDSSPALIRRSVESLGFHWSDIKILLISHAHSDHCAGSAQILRETHAKYEVMAPDVSVVQSGGATDFNYGRDKTMRFPPARVYRILHDGDKVSLGGVTLTAHLTAGHTKGATTWTMDEIESGRTLHVVIVGGPNVNPGYKLVKNAAYPQIADDYRHEFEVLKNLPCDIFLGAHGGYFDLTEKYARLRAGDRNAFIDPAGYKAYVADREQAFEAEFNKQSAK
jgi:metallo-beta-lactamase class B